MRNKIRKLLIGFLIFAMIGCLAACGKASLSGDDIAGSKTTAQTTVKETTTKKDSETTISETTSAETEAEQTTAYNGGGGYVEPEPQTQAPVETTTQNPVCTVSVTIDGCGYGGYNVLYSGSISYTGSMSVYDILCQTGVSFSGSGYYVSEIGGLAEKEHGPMSGWEYDVNGVTPGKSCGNYYVNNGDVIYWHYVEQP